MTEEYLTIPEAAKELGISRARAYQLVQKGKLKYEEIPFEERYTDFAKPNLSKFRIPKQAVEDRKKELEQLSLLPNLNGAGRPVTHKSLVEQWQKEHPYRTRYACAKALGMTYTTVCRYWNATLAEEEMSALIKGSARDENV